MRPYPGKTASTGDPAPLCLIVDARLLGTAGGVNPEAMALLGTALRLDAELALSRLGQRVHPVLEDDGSGALAAACAVARRRFDAVAVPGGAVRFCAAGAVSLVLARAPRSGDTVWVLGDTLYGLADVDDADRRLREFMQVPVPRPVAPGMICGELVRLPVGTPRSTLLRAVFEAERTGWTLLGGHPLVYSESAEQVEAMLALPGAARLARTVRRARLRLLASAPADAVPLFVLPGMALIESVGEDAAGMPWRDLRFPALDRIGVQPSAGPKIMR